ncbi:MAG: hypothetical protein WD068_03495 [Candidatus Babeliales bacterium]
MIKKIMILSAFSIGHGLQARTLLPATNFGKAYTAIGCAAGASIFLNKRSSSNRFGKSVAQAKNIGLLGTLAADMWHKGPVRTWFGNHPKITGFFMGTPVGIMIGIGVGAGIFMSLSEARKPAGSSYFIWHDSNIHTKEQLGEKFLACLKCCTPESWAKFHDDLEAYQNAQNNPVPPKVTIESLEDFDIIPT